MQCRTCGQSEPKTQPTKLSHAPQAGASPVDHSSGENLLLARMFLQEVDGRQSVCLSVSQVLRQTGSRRGLQIPALEASASLHCQPHYRQAGKLTSVKNRPLLHHPSGLRPNPSTEAAGRQAGRSCMRFR
jgi:hypothetical protein